MKEKIYQTNFSRIEIDITYRCNLNCYHCTRSVGNHQAPSDDSMTIDQIERFLSELKEKDRIFKHISLLGGEPTLHPYLDEIIKLFVNYVTQRSPKTFVNVVTNGRGKKARYFLKKYENHDFIKFSISNKTEHPYIQYFLPFNHAPVDRINFNTQKSIKGCCFQLFIGLGLTPYGFYHCVVAGGGIDRVIGLDLGRKSLPDIGDDFIEEKKLLCRYCGLLDASVDDMSKSFSYQKVDKADLKILSPIWIKFYNKYKKNKIKMSLY